MTIAGPILGIARTAFAALEKTTTPCEQPGSLMIFAVTGCVWIVPKNGAVEVTTSNALHDIVPVATRFVPIRPS